MSDTVKKRAEDQPNCNFCRNLAWYDFKTNRGPWAYGCEAHWIEHRLYNLLGTGKGQKFIID